MKFILLLLLSTSAIAVDTQNVFQLGSAVGSKNPCMVMPVGGLGSPKIVTLSSMVASATSGHFLMLSNWGSKTSTGQYQVPSGKKFKSCSISFYANNLNSPLALGYGTAALIADDTATAPTGVIYYSSGTGIASLFSGAATTRSEYPFYAEFPALSYPFIQTQTGSTFNVIITGIEQ